MSGAIIFTLLSWVVGMILDANIDVGEAGFLSLRIVLPILVMGSCIIKTIDNKSKKEKKDTEEEK